MLEYQFFGIRSLVRTGKMAPPLIPWGSAAMKKHKAAISETLKQEFKKDLELFQYFLVLLNSSSPIRNVELMWADDLELFDPSQRPRINTGDALVQLQHGTVD